MEKFKRTAACLLGLLLAVSILGTVPAQAGYDSSGTGYIQLTVEYHPNGLDPTMPTDDESIQAKGYRLYQIADLNETRDGFVLREKYTDMVATAIPTTYTPFNVYERASSDVIRHIGEYINQRSPDIEPDYAAAMVNGRAQFTDLPEGLYLGTGAQIVCKGYTYTPIPFLICLPYMAADGQEVPDGSDVTPGVEYNDLIVNVKYVRTGGGGSGGGGGGGNPQPDPPGPPDNPDPPSPPDDPDQPVPPDNPNPPGQPDNPDPSGPSDNPDPDSPASPDEPVPVDINPDEPVPVDVIPDEPTPPGPTDPAAPAQEDRLPQTGQLWWPVPMLAAAGVVLTVLGLWGRRRAE